MDVLGPDPRAGRPSVAAVPYTPLPSGDPESVAGRPVKIYRRRWYTLLVFCLLNMTQGLVWNTWGPVSDSASLVFGWTDPQIGLFANLGNISFCLTVFIGAYILDVIGMYSDGHHMPIGNQTTGHRATRHRTFRHRTIRHPDI